jgi:hypothetical protein
MSTLPFELTDRIIDFLHSDRQALITCAQVCRNWIPSSRYHLCETLHFSSHKTTAFISLLRSNASTIEKYARTLRLHWRRLVNLAPYLGRFLALRSLILMGVQVEIDVTDEDLSQWFHGIMNLDIASFGTDCLEDFLRLMAAFQSLDTLILDMRSNFIAVPSPSITFPPRLRVLCINLSDCKHGSSFFSNTQFPPLVELELCRIRPLDLQAIDDLLQSLQPTLRILKLRFSSKCTSSYIIKIININLKFEATYPRGPPTNISEIFCHIPTTFHLTEVELDRHLFDNFLWDDLSQVLLRPQFSMLRRVSLILRPGHVRRSWKDKVFEQMSSLHSRGILSVTEIID